MGKIYILPLIITVLFLWSCDDPHEGSTYQVYDVNPASSYLESRSDDFSEWIEVLKYADLYNAINQASEAFTVFVPDNNAVQQFYAKKGVSSIIELGEEYARNLAQYHIIADSIPLDEFVIGGKLEQKTLSDDYLSVSFLDEDSSEGGFNSLYIDTEAHVSEIAIQVSNGYVYVIEAVLNPVVESLYDRVKESPNLTIFKQALDATSWSDSLNVIYDEVKQSNGGTMKTKRDYTLLAVSDEVFAKDDIRSFDDLVQKLDASTDYKEAENELNRYVAYHIIKSSYSVFELQSFDGSTKTKLWDTVAGVVLELSLESDDNFYLNYKSDDFKARFIESASDIQAKNGVMHQIDGYLPIWESVTPVAVLFDFCSYAEVGAYIKQYGTDGQTYQTVAASEYRTEVTYLSSVYTVEIGSAGSNSGIYNPVDYFTAKSGNAFKDSNNGDQLILNLGYLGTISMKTPVIITGKYKVTLQFSFSTTMDFMRTMSSSSNGGMMGFSFDGEHAKDVIPYPTVPSKTLGLYQCVAYEELEFIKTGSHTFKIIVKDPVASTNTNFRIQLDFLHFEPITE